MIHIKKKNFILLLVVAVVTTVLAMTGGFLLFCKVQNVGLIEGSKYKQMVEINNKYAKLYAMQYKINHEGLKKVSEETEMDAVYKGLVGSLKDPYSEYFTAREAQEFDNYVNASFYGIGVMIAEEGGEVQITQVQEDGPADLAGLKAGDVITAVEGKHYDTTKEVKKAVSGKSGTKVKVTYRRKGKEKTVSVTRGIVSGITCNGLMLKGNIAYIRIDTFGEKTGKEFQEAVDKLKKEDPKGLIIDLRNNRGGYMDQGLKVADILLPECTIAFTKDRNGKRTNYNSEEGALQLPCVLLVNENTASASELLAAAVKDNDAGQLVGTTTYGKGVVQSEYKYKDGSALKLTTAEYFSPKGHRINGKGVKPDVEVDFPEDATEDPQLKKAMSLVDAHRK
ncbi:S41 family peptidase [Eubacterium sp. AB3007]|uniref:S41 family peptidase n=1 Tax=Eubacterium sp. AB3007 TaxID=1392487 RepID=UPI00068E7003|nr:S41 family peptidase [Eubacterium sp. AB3007]MBQ1471674.1 S41 family peptidase [Eubacterium sp.]